MYAMYFAFLCSGFLSTIIGAILPYMRDEYNLSYVASGAAISFHQIGNFCAVLIAGYLPYAIGRKKSTLLLSSGKAIGLVLMMLTGNPVVLLVAFTLTGIGRGSLSNITNVVMAEISPKKSSALNILHSTFAVGAFLAPFLVILFTKGDGTSWRIPVTIVVLLECFSLLLIFRSNLSSKPMTKKEDRGRDYYKNIHWWLNTGILFFYLCSEASIIGWLVTYLKESGRMSMGMAQSSSSLLWIMIMVGRLTCASLPSKVNKNYLLLVLGLCQTACFLMMISSTTNIMTLISVLLFGLFMSATYPTTLSTMPSRYNSSTVATGSCIAIATIGAITMPLVIGAVAEKSGMAGGIATIMFALLCMIALIIIKCFVERKTK